jgi:CRP/FNR family cyclic AMP-dependent transcriptional regulator
MKGIDALLAEHPFFRDMGTSHLQLFAGCASNVRFDAGTYIFREGAEADRFLLIRHGRVAIEAHVPHRGAITIQTLGEGEIVGWSWMFPPYRWVFDIKALEVVRAIAFDAVCIRQKSETDPALGYALLKRLTPMVISRLQATRLQILDVYGSGGARARTPA